MKVWFDPDEVESHLVLQGFFERCTV